MAHLFSRILLAIGLLMVVAASAQAQTWADFATVSMTNPTTPKLINRNLCYSDGTDLFCEGAAGQYTTSGTLSFPAVATGGLTVTGNTSLAAVSATNVSATGNVSAVKFIGDGSGLTGVVASTGDRLVSGTTSMVAVSSTGYISVTQSGTNTAWFDPTRGLVTLGVSSTGTISGTNGYFNGALSVTGNSSQNAISATNISATGNVSAIKFIGDGSGLTGVVASTGDRLVSGTTSMVAVSSTGYISVTQSGTNTAWFDPSRGLVTLGVSATGAISGTSGYFTNSIGLGTTTPAISFTVVGEVQVSNSNIACGTATRGAIRYSGTTLQYCNATTWTSLGTAGAADWYGVTNIPTAVQNVSNGTIISTTTHNGQYASFTTLTASTAAVGGFTVTGNSALASVSATNVSATGNVSAVKFIGDGSGLTGVVASTGDRLVSGTTSMVAVSNTGYISVTQSGTNTAWFDPARGLVTIGVSSTGAISGTNGYFNGALTATGSASLGGLTVTGNSTQNAVSATNISATGNVSAVKFIGDGSGLTGVVASTGDRLVSGTTSMVAVSSTGFISVTQSGTNTAWFDPARGLVTLGVSATGAISGTSGYFLRSVGIGTASPAISLTVIGEVQVSNSGVACGTTTRGAIRFNGTDLQYCDSTAWTSLADAGTADWYSVTNIPTAVQNVSNGTIVSVTTLNSRYASLTTIAANGVSATNISATGNVSAVKFIGDGSGLTGVVASTGDRLVSGTTSMVAVSNTGYISVTQSGTNTAWFDPARGLVTIGVSSTGAISGTAGYFNGALTVTGNGSLGSLAVTGNSVLAAISSTNISATGNVSAVKFIGDGSGLTGVVASTGDRLVSGTTSMVAVSTTGFISVTQSGTNTAWFDPSRGLVTLGVSATGAISGTSGYFTNSIGLGTTSPAISFTVVGEVQVSNSNIACGTSTRGAIRYSGTTLQYCNASTWTSLGTAGAADWYGVTNIPTAVQNVSNGTVISTTTHNGQYASFTTLVAGGVSATNISATGNVSAVKFIGDGSGLTGVVASTGDRLVSGTTSMVAVSSTGYISVTQSGTNTAWFDPARGLVTLGVSATGFISASAVYSQGAVQIGGTGSESCSSASDFGKSRRNPTSGHMQVCR